MKPYCTPAMLKTLILLPDQLPIWHSQTWWDLKSRGWMDDREMITQKGLDYVNLRASLTQKEK